MILEVTKRAQNKLEELGFKPNESVLLIIYETDGCGCAVNGVSRLQEVKPETLTEEEKMVETESSPYRTAIQKRAEWAYDEKLKIDFSLSANTFQLKSPNEMLNPRMSYQPSV
ncbi:iron-sulfur cluster biosynthesis family protein [Salipaludibacillus sp. CUR1]|uniref:iron-sulfur cluster biosynthesis family protein n=1 Tax=Salipaludibacillus sp. CUR1 TaxID=2820003 RepID=UPI001E5F1374|nr:iron-sulfur cluster biosynthesis family protein [Salipaludibacillus sp. CUR1]MCE7794260.1 iron-sulfur cluster biosynthesis family protein [Salipaludibacillus sp. CUR1]